MDLEWWESIRLIPYAQVFPHCATWIAPIMCAVEDEHILKIVHPQGNQPDASRDTITHQSSLSFYPPLCQLLPMVLSCINVRVPHLTSLTLIFKKAAQFVSGELAARYI